MRKIMIAPSMMCSRRIREDIESFERTHIDLLHFDIMDGRFVKNVAFQPSQVNEMRKISSLRFQVHILAFHPEEIVEQLSLTTNDIVTFHYESIDPVGIDATVDIIKRKGYVVGIALNPEMPVDLIFDTIGKFHEVVVMGVKPGGFRGRLLLPHMYEKIAILRDIINRKRLNTLIEIDGGVHFDTLEPLIVVGVDIMVVGSVVFDQGGTIEEAVANLRSLTRV